jgi:hypothetical protein
MLKLGLTLTLDVTLGVIETDTEILGVTLILAVILGVTLGV